MSRSLTRLTVTVAAVLITTATAAVITAIHGPVEAVRPGATSPEEIPLVAVAIATAQAVLVGWASLAGLERWAPRAARFWPALAAVLTALSLTPLIGQPVALGSVLALASLHLVAALVAIPGLTRTGRARVPEVAAR